MDSPERFAELTWEGIKNKYLYGAATSLDEAIALANTEIFDNKKGIATGYNMWNVPGSELINGTTGKFNSAIKRKYNPENWEDHIFRTGQKIEGDVRISGGSEKTTFFTSLGYLKDEGYYMESDFERFNARSNVSSNLSSWLKSTINMSYSNMKINSPGQSDENINNGFQFVNAMPALYPVYERDDGNLIEDTRVGGYRYDYGNTENRSRAYGGGINPVGSLRLDKKETKHDQFAGNALFEAKFLSDFKLSSNIGLQYIGSRQDELTNPYYGDAEGLGRITKTQASYKEFTFNQILSYVKSFDLHNFDAFVAHEYSTMDYSYTKGQKSLLVRSDNTEWSNAVIMGYMDSDTYGYTIESYFGQIKYNYDEKYHFNASLRSDGSSRFSKGNKWGTFGSVGAAWVLTKEESLSEIDWLNNLKYKLSWGLLGNQDISTGNTRANFYPYEDLYSISNMNDKPSFSFVYKGNPNLTWEKSSIINTGIEFDIFNFLSGEVEYFHKTTTDMLFLKQVAPSLGYASYPVNDGKMINQGLEFNLTANIVKTNDVKFDFRVNGGHYSNKITQMPIDETTGLQKPIELKTPYAWSKGHSYYDFYLREYAGVDPETGMALYNQYYNVKANGKREPISEMETYASKLH
ncbi:TonB-dependent receptor [Massilibacteroides sp.]|uniref:TonB-dependent receptor n=1 Tax=Massilibacteroides sp. TaxID=2034766 RepID=UPI0026024C87|nr:TonB-dependent receptor [Massilibacteroides sp.]MDD4515469.1 TonB-dependent receptor [Massilibacteroides sp.]